MKYLKDTPRITVKIYDSKTEELLIEITNRNWTNIGEIYPSDVVSSLMTTEWKNKKKTPPAKVLVMIAEEYTLQP